MTVVGSVGAEACLDTWLGDSEALLRITDARLLSVRLGVDPDRIPDHPLSFEDDSGRVVPWAVGEWILRCLARRFPEECLAEAEHYDDEIEDLRSQYSYRGKGVRNEQVLKVMRECREASETLRKWATATLD